MAKKKGEDEVEGKRERIKAGLKADHLHLAVLRKELEGDQIILTNLEKKMAETREAIVRIESKINELEAKLDILRK